MWGLHCADSAVWTNARVNCFSSWRKIDGLMGHCMTCQVDGAHGSTGDVSVDVSFFAAPVNDNFADAAPVTTGYFSIVGATLEPNEPSATAAWLPSGSIWFTTTVPAGRLAALVRLAMRGLCGPCGLCGRSCVCWCVEL